MNLLLRLLKNTTFMRAMVLALVLSYILLGGWLILQYYSPLIKVNPGDNTSFYWPYYLYVPDKVADRAKTGEVVHLLVIPNNSGKTHDNFGFHQSRAIADLCAGMELYDEMGVAVLMPIFPRPQVNWRIYTQALDRDALETEFKTLARLDLQLVAMIDDAMRRLAGKDWQVHPKVLMWGFSASGMFVNRFTILHPERVAAAVAGSPGGWPIAPVARWHGNCLRYPIGVCDLKELTGENLNLEEYIKVSQFFFIGDQDETDSVPQRDAFDPADEALIMKMFGIKPINRWPVAQSIYRSVNADAEFRIYKGLGHDSGQALPDIVTFFKQIIKADKK